MRESELKKDFEKCLEKIDFEKYNPYSREFMSALFIGQMWLCIKSLENDLDIEDEIQGAEKYFEMYKSTKDSNFREMAKDELKHAGQLIRRAKQNGTHSDHLQAYEEKIQDLSKLIENKVME